MTYNHYTFRVPRRSRNELTKFIQTGTCGGGIDSITEGYSTFCIQIADSEEGLEYLNHLKLKELELCEVVDPVAIVLPNKERYDSVLRQIKRYTTIDIEECRVTRDLETFMLMFPVMTTFHLRQVEKIITRKYKEHGSK